MKKSLLILALLGSIGLTACSPPCNDYNCGRWQYFGNQSAELRIAMNNFEIRIDTLKKYQSESEPKLQGYYDRKIEIAKGLRCKYFLDKAKDFSSGELATACDL